MKIYKHNRSKIYGAEASSKPEGASTSFLSKTDNDYYNDILCNPELYPNMIANIVWMTPDDFIVQCATGAGVTVDDVLDVLTQQTIDDYAAQMRSGVKFYLPYLVYKQQGNIEHEGRHRALAAKSNGDKFIPILIIKDKSNKHINHEIKAIVCRPSDKYSVENCPVFLDFEHSNSFADFFVPILPQTLQV